MLQTVAVVVALIGVLSLIFSLLLQLTLWRLVRRNRSEQALPPISVLKPLKGADDDLFENLASLARQNYPQFELVLGCEDIADPALAVVQRLRQTFPEVAMTIVAGARTIGLNPKVNNLKQLEAAARYEHLLISDADVRVGPDYLRSTVAEMSDPEVGLVSNLIAGVGESSLGSVLENLHLNTFVAETVCGAAVLAKHPCVVGKSMLFRRSDFQRLGGWDQVKNVLAEDYVIGQLYARAGFRVALSPYAICAINRKRRVREFFARHVRWGQMRRSLAPRMYWGEPLLLTSLWFGFAFGLALLDARGIGEAGSVHRTILLTATLGLGLNLLSSGVFVWALRKHTVAIKDLLLLPLKDLAMIVIWFSGALRTTVCWRGNQFQIGRGSVLYVTEKVESAVVTAVS